MSLENRWWVVKRDGPKGQQYLGSFYAADVDMETKEGVVWTTQQSATLYTDHAEAVENAQTFGDSTTRAVRLRERPASDRRLSALEKRVTRLERIVGS